MISVSKQNDNIAYNLVELILDAETDIADLPTDVAAGSVAYVVATGKVLMLNNLKQWVVQ